MKDSVLYLELIRLEKEIQKLKTTDFKEQAKEAARLAKNKILPFSFRKKVVHHDR